MRARAIARLSYLPFSLGVLPGWPSRTHRMRMAIRPDRPHSARSADLRIGFGPVPERIRSAWGAVIGPDMYLNPKAARPSVGKVSIWKFSAGGLAAQFDHVAAGPVPLDVDRLAPVDGCGGDLVGGAACPAVDRHAGDGAAGDLAGVVQAEAFGLAGDVPAALPGGLVGIAGVQPGGLAGQLAEFPGGGEAGPGPQRLGLAGEGGGQVVAHRRADGSTGTGRSVAVLPLGADGPVGVAREVERLRRPGQQGGDGGRDRVAGRCPRVVGR